MLCSNDFLRENSASALLIQLVLAIFFSIILTPFYIRDNFFANAQIYKR